jgi:hypothetical protein
MTSEKLAETVGKIASAVVEDPRWQANQDDLGVSVLGMLLYGYALAVGRVVMLLDVDQIDEAVVNAVMTHIGSAEKWTRGMVAAAARAAFDKSYHVGHYELIGVGHQYFIAAATTPDVVDNVFANIASVRARV